MSRYDTTPSDVDRNEARALLDRMGDDADLRQSMALGRIGFYVRELRELEDPGDARMVALARAMFDAYLDEEGNNR